MGISKVTISYLTSMESFEFQSQSYYLICAAVIVFLNLFIMFLFTTMNFPRGQASKVILLNLAVSDFCYETISTPLLVQCGCRKSSILVNCKSMYYVYLTFNISTVLHILIQIAEKLLNAYFAVNHRSLIGYHTSVFCSLLAWCGSGILAYICSRSDTGFLSEEAMVLVGRFKVFGYILFGVIAISATVLLSATLCFMRAEKTTEKESLPLFMEHGEKLNDLQPCNHNSPPLQEESRDGFVFCCIFFAFFVGWFGWLVIGEENEILRSLEIMKSFEFIRFAARILNPMVLLYTFLKVDTRFWRRGEHQSG